MDAVFDRAELQRADRRTGGILDRDRGVCRALGDRDRPVDGTGAVRHSLGARCQHILADETGGRGKLIVVQ